MSDYLPVTAQLIHQVKDELGKVNKKWLDRKVENYQNSCSYFYIYSAESSGYLHFEYLEGYVELHCEAQFLRGYKKLREFLIIESKKNSRLSWCEWKNHENARCRIDDGQIIQTSEEVCEKIIALAEFFDPLIAKYFSDYESFSPPVAPEVSINYDKVPDEFKNLCHSFFGSTAGNIRSPIWFCGLEWGGGYDADTPILLDTLKPYGFRELHTWTADSFRKSFWASGSPYCQNVIKLLVGLQQGHYQSCDNITNFKWRPTEVWFEDLGRRHIVGPHGLAMVLNMFPISVPNRNVSTGSWNSYQVRMMNGKSKKITDWSGLTNFYDYLNAVIEFRHPLFTDIRKTYKPKLIICFGKDSKDSFSRLWGATSNVWTKKVVSLDKGEIDFEYTILDDETLLVVAPFPANASGINSDEKINKISFAINQLCKESLGEGWLNGYEVNAPIGDDPKSYPIFNDFDKLNKLKSQIDDFKESINLINTHLETWAKQAEEIQKSKETLKEYIECEANTSNLDSLNGQIEQLKKTVWDQLGTLDELKSTTENQIQDIEAKLWEKYDPNFYKTLK